MKKDQHLSSPYKINTLLRRQVMRVKENIEWIKSRWSNIKFSKLLLEEIYGNL